MAEERAPNYAEGAGLFWRKQAHAASVCPQGLNQSPRHKQGSSWGTKGHCRNQGLITSEPSSGIPRRTHNRVRVCTEAGD